MVQQDLAAGRDRTPLKAIFERHVAGEKVLDHAFVDEHTMGIEAVRAMSSENSGLVLTRDGGIEFAVRLQLENGEPDVCETADS